MAITSPRGGETSDGSSAPAVPPEVPAPSSRAGESVRVGPVSLQSAAGTWSPSASAGSPVPAPGRPKPRTRKARSPRVPKAPRDWYSSLPGTNQVLFLIIAGIFVTGLFFFTTPEFTAGATTEGYVIGVLIVFGAALALAVVLLAVPIGAMSEQAPGGRSLSDSIVALRGDFMNSIREAVLADKGETMSLGGPSSTITSLSEDARDEVETLVIATSISANIVEKLPAARQLLQRTLIGAMIAFPFLLGVGRITELLPQTGQTVILVFFGTVYIGAMVLGVIWGPRGAGVFTWSHRVNALRSQSLPAMRRTIRGWAEDD
jgi:hypothetical protein